MEDTWPRCWSPNVPSNDSSSVLRACTTTMTSTLRLRRVESLAYPATRGSYSTHSPGSGGEVLVLESGRDELIPHDVIEAYIAACPKAMHRVIPGATHALSKPAWNEVFVATITEWFADL